MRKSQYPKVGCDYCGKVVRVGKDGRLFTHVKGQGLGECKGSGEHQSKHWHLEDGLWQSPTN